MTQKKKSRRIIRTAGFPEYHPRSGGYQRFPAGVGCDNSTNERKYIMNPSNTPRETGNNHTETAAKHFAKEFGPGADKWLVDGVLPQVGIALIEADSLQTAAVVASDIAYRVQFNCPWAGRPVLYGHAIEYDGNGEGYADAPELIRDDLPPRLDLANVEPIGRMGRDGKAVELHSLWDFPEAVTRQGGARLVVVHLTDPDATAGNTYAMCAMVDIARELQCCVLLVTGELSEFARRELHDTAAAVLRVNSGHDIALSKGNANQGPWTFSVELDAGGSPVVKDIWESTRAH